MHEYNGSVLRGRRKNVLHPLVVQPIPVHGREQANAAQPVLAKRAREPPGNIARDRIEHEETDEAGPVATDGCGDGALVPGNARDDCRPCDAAPVELPNPAIGQLGGAARILPAKVMRYCGRAVGI